MASLSKPVDYECEFVDQVPEDYLCKLCKHVAREPTIASCCTEVLCKTCIDAVIQDKKPCPSCKSINIGSQGPQKKYQAKIMDLNVHCTKKEHGCDWIGQLQHLDAHLHDCGYAYIQCEQCNQDVQKRNMDTHLVEECPEREYMCKYCNFKATYRKISDQHLKVCSYCPVVCPNRCGATFERGELEDHMKMCPLQKIRCEFSYAGCQAEFIRNKQKEHMEQNTQKHLALMAAATLRISQEQQQNLEQLQATQNHLQLQQEALDRNLQEQHNTSATFIKHTSGQLETQQEDIRKQQFQQEEFERNLQEQHNTTTAKFQREVLEEVIPKQEQELDDKLQQQQRMYEERIAAVEQELREKERVINLQQAMDKRWIYIKWGVTASILVVGVVCIGYIGYYTVRHFIGNSVRLLTGRLNRVERSTANLTERLNGLSTENLTGRLNNFERSTANLYERLNGLSTENLTGRLNNLERSTANLTGRLNRLSTENLNVGTDGVSTEELSARIDNLEANRGISASAFKWMGWGK